MSETMTTSDNDTLYRLTRKGFRTSKSQSSGYRCCMCNRMQPAGVVIVVPCDLLRGKHSSEQVTLALAATPGGGGGCCVRCAGSLLSSADTFDGRSLRSPSALGIYD